MSHRLDLANVDATATATVVAVTDRLAKSDPLTRWPHATI